MRKESTPNATMQGPLIGRPLRDLSGMGEVSPIFSTPSAWLGFAGERRSKRPWRDEIITELLRAPGINETQLGQKIGLPRGTLRHHLQVLERVGALHAFPIGREKHLFLGQTKPELVDVLARLRQGRGCKCLVEVLAQPGLSQQDLAARVGMTRKIIRGYLNELVRLRTIEERPMGRLRRYYPGPAVTPGLMGMLCSKSTKWLRRSALSPDPDLGVSQHW